MMRKQWNFYWLVALSLVGCANNNHEPAHQTAKQTSNSTVAGLSMVNCAELDRANSFLPADSANSMISSYLVSINASETDTTVRSFLVNADNLRNYLNSDSTIKKVKVMLAHNKKYISEGGFGVAAGLSPEALTIIIAGYDDKGDYKFFNGNNVLNYSSPCPKCCPTTGTASEDLFPTE